MLKGFDLTGKNALVTGSDKGLGAAIALAFAEAGANVVIHGRTSDSTDICGQVRAKGRKAVFFAADLTKPETCPELVSDGIRELGSLDVLVNNAGMIRRAPAADHSEKDWNEVMAVDLTAVFRLSQLVGRHMLERRQGGKILNIASLLSFQGGILVPAYAAAKGGIAQLTKALANEWAGKGINVNAIAPGYMTTDNTKALREDTVRSRQILERIPAGRWGNPEDLCGAAVFFCSSAADYVHGQILAVDGGWLAR
jgi:2-deoxy-D-gluconate 3-dehydrogenase